MLQFVVQNKDVLGFCFAFVGIFSALCFGGVLGWRHKICFDYKGKRDVASSILNDQFVQQSSLCLEQIVEEISRSQIKISEIYKRPEQQKLIKDQAAVLEKSNRVTRCFTWLDRLSHFAFFAVWCCIVLSAFAVTSIWITPFAWVIWAWTIGFCISVFGFGSCITLMWYLDGKFFGIVNAIIDAED